MRQTARRIDGGQPIRAAMAAAGMTLQEVSARTKELDPRGVSFQAVSFVATDKGWARETTSARSADLIEDALSVARGSLFTRPTTTGKPAVQDPEWADL